MVATFAVAVVPQREPKEVQTRARLMKLHDPHFLTINGQLQLTPQGNNSSRPPLRRETIRLSWSRVRRLA